MNSDDLDDILNDPIFDLTETEKELFDLPEVLRKAKAQRRKVEDIAYRKPCDNFALYASMFRQVHKDLAEGKRHLVRFKEANLQEKVFFIADGLMGYVDVLDTKKRQIKDRVRKDGRSRVIYEDGTESNILFRTIGKNITRNGYVVTEPNDGNELSAFSGQEQIFDDDRTQGWIYVLRSLSEDERIATVKNLYKIGYSTNPVEVRIRNARNESTYLFADVEIVATYKVYNMNIKKVEDFIHTFFDSARFYVTVGDAEPEEWFIVPLHIIKRAIAMLVDGSIVHYIYNAEQQALEEIPISS